MKVKLTTNGDCVDSVIDIIKKELSDPQRGLSPDYAEGAIIVIPCAGYVRIYSLKGEYVATYDEWEKFAKLLYID